MNHAKEISELIEKRNGDLTIQSRSLLISELKKADQEFWRENNPNNFSLLPFSQLGTLISQDTEELGNGLPHFISIGCMESEKYTHILSLFDNQLADPNGIFQKTFTKISVPAIVNLRKSTGVEFQFDSEPQLETGRIIIQQIGLRLLLSVNPKLCKFTVMDSEGLGQNASLLSKFGEKSVDILEQNEDLNRLFERLRQRVLECNQKFLRTSDEWLFEFNEHQQNPEPYHFVLIPSFKGNIAKDPDRLISFQRLIEKNRAGKAGIYFLCVNDTHDSLGDNFSRVSYPPDHREDAGRIITQVKSSTEFTDGWDEGFKYEPDDLFAEIKGEGDLFERLQVYLDQARKSSGRVKVVLDRKEAGLWTKSSEEGISIPIGRTSQKIQTIDLLNPPHALIGGGTGSGKSVLLHNIITHGAWLYSPQELEMVLMDFKEGVEFYQYKDLPHVQILAASDVPYGHSVLMWLEKEMKERNKLFREAGAKSIGEYNRDTTGKTLPRKLIIIDEFQVLFAYSNTSSSSNVFDSLCRLSRSVGFHFILSSQSLGNVTLESSTQSQLGIRICLRMMENDIPSFLEAGNDIPKTYTRAGQALHNNTQGSTDGNTEFQVAFESDEDRSSVVKRLGDKAKVDGVFPESREIYSDEAQQIRPDEMAESKRNQKLVLGRQSKVFGEFVRHDLSPSLGNNLFIHANNEDYLRSVWDLLGRQIFDLPSVELVAILDADLLNKHINQMEEICLNADNPSYKKPNGLSEVWIFWKPEEIPQLWKQGSEQSQEGKKLGNFLEKSGNMGVTTITFTKDAKRLSDCLQDFPRPEDLMHFSLSLSGSESDLRTLYPNENIDSLKFDENGTRAIGRLNNKNPDLEEIKIGKV